MEGSKRQLRRRNGRLIVQLEPMKGHYSYSITSIVLALFYSVYISVSDSDPYPDPHSLPFYPIPKLSLPPSTLTPNLDFRSFFLSPNKQKKK